MQCPQAAVPKKTLLASTSERKGGGIFVAISGCSARGKLYSGHKENVGMPFLHLNLLLVYFLWEAVFI